MLCSFMDFQFLYFTICFYSVKHFDSHICRQGASEVIFLLLLSLYYANKLENTGMVHCVQTCKIAQQETHTLIHTQTVYCCFEGRNVAQRGFEQGSNTLSAICGTKSAVCRDPALPLTGLHRHILLCSAYWDKKLRTASPPCL